MVLDSLPEPTEAQTQRAILDYLLARGHYVWRNNTGMFTGEYKGRKRFIRAGLKGSADIIGVERVSGQLIAIEVKRRGGKIRPEQLEFIAEITRRRGLAFVAYSLDDVINHGL